MRFLNDNELKFKIPMLPPDLMVGQVMNVADAYPWNMEMIKLEALHENFTGEGVKIGIIDTGYYEGHPELDDDVELFTTMDDYMTDGNGHGTHVRGIIEKIAPDARLVICKALDDAGSGYAHWIAKAIYECVHKDCQIINLSLGMGGISRDVQGAIRYAFSNGVQCVAASGNESAKEVSFPANMGEVTAVGAVDYRKALAWFSNQGVTLDLVAPGKDINSTWINGKFRKSSGTSMACPHVAGVMALYFQSFKESNHRFPNHQEVRQWIGEAEDLGADGLDNEYGFGLVSTDFADSNLKRIDKNKVNAVFLGSIFEISNPRKAKRRLNKLDLTPLCRMSEEVGLAWRGLRRKGIIENLLKKFKDATTGQ